MITILHCVLLLASVVGPVPADAQVLPLESVKGLEPRGVDVSAVEYRGRKAVRVVETAQGAGDSVVLLPGSDFEDGVIEVELAGRPGADAVPSMRGFIGIAFRVEGVEQLRYDCLYLRPTNARAEEQLRRNHSTQYVAHPDWPWYRMRQQYPGKYESYVDLESGAWTKLRIEVAGRSARLYVDDHEQPVLIVGELKGTAERGGIALWIGQGTEAHFRNLRIMRADR